MKPSEQRWPAQQPPDDFADRVVQMGLHAARANWAEVDLNEGASFDLFGVFRRAVVGWSLAAAFAVAAVVLYVGKIRPEIEARARFARSQLAEAHEALTSKDRELGELRAKVDALQVELQDERTRGALSEARRASGLAQVPGWRAALSAGSSSAGSTGAPGAASARPSTSRLPCNCQPGDALCACF